MTIPRRVRRWLAGGIFPWLLPLAPAQDGVATCDRSAIEWVLPGDFPRALERAKAEQRILVVKGISFGVDVAGAKCATKGVW
jgi:hypothetical protein